MSRRTDTLMILQAIHALDARLNHIETRFDQMNTRIDTLIDTLAEHIAHGGHHDHE